MLNQNKFIGAQLIHRTEVVPFLITSKPVPPNGRELDSAVKMEAFDKFDILLFRLILGRYQQIVIAFLATAYHLFHRPSHAGPHGTSRHHATRPTPSEPLQTCCIAIKSTQVSIFSEAESRFVT